MSSEKTGNLGLHKWAPTDGVLRTEFNDNFGKIDEKVAGIGDLALIPQSNIIDALKDKDDKLATVNEQLADVVTVIKPTGTFFDSSNINALLQIGNGKFLFKNGTYNLDADILAKSNSVLEWEEGAIFKRNGTTSDNAYKIVYLNGVENVTLVNPTIIGDRSTHIGTTGEHGHGIAIQGTKNIKVRNAVIRDCWGDGIYIGAAFGGGKVFAEDTWLDNITCDNNRRNNISIISVKGLFIRNSKLLNANGTDPQAGIDFEPNTPDHLLEDIFLDNIVIKGSGKRGIFFCLWLMFGDRDSSPIKKVSITLNNVKVDGGVSGFETLLSNFTGNVSPEVHDRTAIKNLNGSIVLNNCEAKNNSGSGLRLYRWYDAGLKLVFNDLKIENPNTAKVVSETGNAAIALYDPNASTTPAEYRLGGVEFNNLEVTHASDDPLKRSIFVSDIKNQNKAKNLIIRNTKKINGTILFSQSLDETCKVVDSNEVHKLIDPVSRPIEKGRDFYTIISNKGAVSTTTKTLRGLNMHNENITFLTEEAQPFVIKCDTGQTFTPFGNNTCTLNGIGSKVTVKRINDTTWQVVEVLGGTWTTV